RTKDANPHWVSDVAYLRHGGDQRLRLGTKSTCRRNRRTSAVEQVGMPSESSVISAGWSPQFCGSSDEPSPFVDIKLHQAFVAHFQQKGLASFLIHDIGAFHDFVDFERLLAE